MIRDTFISPGRNCRGVQKKWCSQHERVHARTHFEYAEAGYGLCVSTIKLEDGAVIKK